MLPEEEKRKVAGEDINLKRIYTWMMSGETGINNTVRHPHTNHELNLTVFSRVLLGSVARCISASRAYTKIRFVVIKQSCVIDA